MKAIRMLAILGALALIGVTPALATTIDFTDGDFWGPSAPMSGVTGKTTYTSGGVTLTSVGGTMTFNNGGDAAGCALTSVGLACDGDGIGINDDEVTGNTNEVLQVTFSSLVNISDVEVLDLFLNESGQNEFVEFSTDGGVSWSAPIISAGNVGSGYTDTGFMASGVSSLWVRGFNNPVSDVSLARLEYEAVPEPATLILLGAGLAGLGVRRRRQS